MVSAGTLRMQARFAEVRFAVGRDVGLDLRHQPNAQAPASVRDAH